MVAASSLGAHRSLSLAGIPSAQLVLLQPSRGSCLSLTSPRQDQWVQGCLSALWPNLTGGVSLQGAGRASDANLALSLCGPCPHPMTSGLWVGLTCSRQGLLLPWELSQAKSLVPEASESTVFLVIILVLSHFGQGRAPWDGWGTTAEILVIHRFVQCFILCKALY